MSDIRGELPPRQVEAPSANTVNASADKVVSKGFKELPNEKGRGVGRLVKGALISSAVPLLASCGLANVDSPIPVSLPRPNIAAVSANLNNSDEIVPYVAPTVTPVERPVPATKEEPETEENRLMREKAEELFPGVHFESIKTGEDPIESRINNEDGLWEEKRSKGYFFEAYKGQRLEATAESIDKEGDFDLETKLYDEKGNLLEGLGTRMSYTAKKTGQYYLIVGNDGNNDVKYKMKLEDENKSGIVVEVIGADGEELFLPDDESLPEVSLKDFGFMIQTNNVINSKSIEPVIYALPQTPVQFKQNAELPEDDAKNQIKTKVTHLDDGRVYVEPEDGQLPQNSQIVVCFPMGNQAVFNYRLFTTSPAK